MKKNILVVEDEFIQGQLIASSLRERGANVYLAKTIAEAKEIFVREQPLLDAILLDGCIASNTPNTQPLIAFFKGKGFEKPIVAISSRHEFSQVLCSAGATHMQEKKPALIKFVLELLE